MYSQTFIFLSVWYTVSERYAFIPSVQMTKQWNMSMCSAVGQPTSWKIQSIWKIVQTKIALSFPLNYFPFQDNTPPHTNSRLYPTTSCKGWSICLMGAKLSVPGQQKYFPHPSKKDENPCLLFSVHTGVNMGPYIKLIQCWSRISGQIPLISSSVMSWKAGLIPLLLLRGLVYGPWGPPHFRYMS